MQIMATRKYRWDIEWVKLNIDGVLHAYYFDFMTSKTVKQKSICFEAISW